MAAPLRCMFTLPRLIRTPLQNIHDGFNITVTRGRKRWLRPVLKQLYNRREDQGPEPERHRSEWLNWNYDSELYAFGKRLGEDFQKQTIRTAFIHKSYLETEKIKREKLGLGEDQIPLDLGDNSVLAEKGEKIASAYVKAYLLHSLPNLPQEGIQSIHDNLLSEESLAYLASNLGLPDLIRCSDFPPEKSTLSTTFKSVIGAVLQDQGADKACRFVEDFVLTQLVGQCVEDLWEIVNPMGLLAEQLAAQGRGEPEARLIWHTGSQTVLASYLVGIYSDQQLLGKGPGETVSTAEETAARDSLRRMFAMGPERAPFKFGTTRVEIDTSNIIQAIDGK